MLTLTLKVTSNIRDVPGHPTVEAVCGEAFAAHLTNMLKDIKDPQTGETPVIVCQPHPEGITFKLRGSEQIRAEAEIRVRAMTKTPL